MLPYWVLFSFFAAGALAERPATARERNASPALAGGALLMALMIGFRYQVGGDWEIYEHLFSRMSYMDLGRALSQGDPGYQFLNWAVQRIGGHIWLVNLVGGLVFSWGVLEFAKVQRNPWLTVLVAVPYLVIVVGMGYTRQAIAIGILMAALARHVRGGSLLRFAAYVAVAALFHRTAVVVFPLAALTVERTRFVNLLISAAAAVLLYDVFLSESVGRFVSGYIHAAYGSEGAAIRVAMCALPALLFLASQRNFAFGERERLTWRNFSLAALLMSVLLFVLPSTTAVDRIALYLIPLQLAVLARIPGAYLARPFGIAIVISYSLAIQYTWLNYASHAQYWIPYQIHPIVPVAPR